MASLGNGFARITYTGLSGIHHAIVPLLIAGTPVAGTEPDVTMKDATTINAQAGIDEYLSHYRDFFPSTTNFGLVEVYSVNPATEERTFIWGYNADIAGTHASVGILWEMFTMTFKTIGGSVAKVVGMEASFAVNVYDTPPFTVATPIDNMAIYMVSDECIHVGRDNTFPFAPLSFRTKTSDVLRKRQPAV